MLPPPPLHSGTDRKRGRQADENRGEERKITSRGRLERRVHCRLPGRGGAQNGHLTDSSTGRPPPQSSWHGHHLRQERHELFVAVLPGPRVVTCRSSITYAWPSPPLCLQPMPVTKTSAEREAWRKTRDNKLTFYCQLPCICVYVCLCA